MACGTQWRCGARVPGCLLLCVNHRGACVSQGKVVQVVRGRGNRRVVGVGSRNKKNGHELNKHGDGYACARLAAAGIRATARLGGAAPDHDAGGVRLYAWGHRRCLSTCGSSRKQRECDEEVRHSD